jgi:hypothetical protein
MDKAEITYEEAEIEGSRIHAKNVVIVLGEYMLTGGQLDGDFEKELVFTGNPTLTYRGQTLTGDAIRFAPKARTYRVDNLRTALTPEFLQGRLLSPLYLSGGDLYGQRGRPIVGEDMDATTCDRPEPHYHIFAGSISVEPGKRVILKRATFFLWGHRIITLPTLIIPLDRRPRRLRISNPPQVGRSVDEGWFVKQGFNYLLADRVPGLFRLDLMEKKGIGTGLEQDWNLVKAVGLLSLYAIPTGGTGRNFSGRISNRQNIGGGETVSIDNDFQQNSYLSLPQTTSINTRFGFNRFWEGMTTNLSLARQATDSQGLQTRNYTANLAQGFQFGRTGSLNLNADYTRYGSAQLPRPDPNNPGSLIGGFSQSTETLSLRAQADERAENYTLQLTANRSVPIGQHQAQSFFGGIEKLPEITLSNYRFTRGWLSQIPATFFLSYGRYSEPTSSFFGGTSVQSATAEDRAILGFDIASTRFGLTRSTDLNIGTGFQQFFYSDGSAQYLLHNETTLTQRWNKRSGLNIAYTYQRPEGGTPFRFDQQGQFHTLNADIGFLDDRRLQLTARVGYDFAQASFSGFRQPWQTLSANLLARPTDWMRLQTLYSFDPNTGKFTSATGDLRFRGHNDFALNLVSRYDPQRHKFGAVNGFFNVPIGSAWRIIGLFQYNGYLNRFESRSLQITRDLHCLEASLTYIDNPFGFRTDRQIFFQLRIKAFPTYQRTGIGQFGQSLDTGVGGIY